MYVSLDFRAGQSAERDPGFFHFQFVAAAGVDHADPGEEADLPPGQQAELFDCGGVAVRFAKDDGCLLLRDRGNLVGADDDGARIVRGDGPCLGYGQPPDEGFGTFPGQRGLVHIRGHRLKFKPQAIQQFPAMG